MWKSTILRISLLVMMLSLCIGVPTASAGDVVPLNWTSPTTNDLYDVFMVSASDGWAVGYGGTMLRWNGTDWSTVTSPTTTTIYSIFVVSADDVWIVGSGGMTIHWNGAYWSTVASPTAENLWSVHIVSSSDGWAVGEAGTIIQWTGTEWIPEFPAAILTPLLISLTLVAVILAKTVLKKRRKPLLSSKTLL